MDDVRERELFLFGWMEDGRWKEWRMDAPLHSQILMNQSNYDGVKNVIINGLKSRMDEDLDRFGNIKRAAWHNNRELVISTILDLRFKMETYFKSQMHKFEEYKSWIVQEAERIAMANEVCSKIYFSILLKF
jgi:hypothetical protein